MNSLAEQMCDLNRVVNDVVLIIFYKYTSSKWKQGNLFTFGFYRIFKDLLSEISQSVNEANPLTIFFLRHTLVHLRGV